jgi:hypothetical protein
MFSIDKLSEMLLQQALKGNDSNGSWGETQKHATSGMVQPLCLGDDVAAQLAKVAPTVASAARAQRCLFELKRMISQLGTDWDVQPFGSFANGFSTVYSDLDVTCCQSGLVPGADAQRLASISLGDFMLPQLRAHRSFTIVQEVLGARVPILKLCFENSLEVDLSCHNPKPLLNTRLLKAYEQMDPRIRDLVVAIKLWAKGSGVCDATKSNLSSYSFTLLVLYFLQVHPDLQLTVLPVEAFQDSGKGMSDARVVSAMSKWNCRLSLAEMMMRFFAFYSNHQADAFLWGSEVVSVRWGRRCAAREPLFSKLRGRHHWRLHIEDLFETERNLHCVLGKAEEEQLVSALTEAWYDIKNSRAPVGLRAAATPRVSSIGRDSQYVPVPVQEFPLQKGSANPMVDWKHTTGASYISDSTKSGGARSDEESGSDAAPSICDIPIPHVLMAGSKKSLASSIAAGHPNVDHRYQAHTRPRRLQADVLTKLEADGLVQGWRNPTSSLAARRPINSHMGRGYDAARDMPMWGVQSF